MIHMLFEHGLDFVVRVPAAGAFAAVGEFLLSGHDEAQIELRCPAKTVEGLLPSRTVRAVRRVGPDGDVQVFLTTLPRTTFGHAEIGQLYERRWQIELFYRLEKSDYVGQRQFHAKYADGVRQEVFAFLIFAAISRTLTSEASQEHKAPYQRMSQKAAILHTAHALTVLLLDSPPDAARRIIAELLERLAQRLDPPHRRRSCRRRSFKPNSRWGPQGRQWEASQHEVR